LSITLNNIISEYHDNLKKYFLLFKEKKTEVQKNEESQKTKGNQNKSKKPTRQLFTLNKRIINKYIYLLNNIY
jgi:uncharacterized protein YutD